MTPTVESSPHRKRIVVVGAGITGLAAAHRVVELAQRDRLPVDVVLLEARDRLGGNILTQKRDGFLIEAGPDSFITQKPWGLALVRRLGLEGQLIPTNPACRRTFVVRKGRMHPVPEGFLLLAPTRIWPFVFSRLFSWPGKLRMGLDLILPAKDHGADGDESLSSFVTRRFGREALDRVAQPLVSGIYTADPTDLSLRATMPRFLEMETKYRSIIMGMRSERRAALQKAAQASAPPAGQPSTPAGQVSQSSPPLSKGGPGGVADSGARYSMFVSLAGGMETLTDALAARLPAGSVRTNTAVTHVEYAAGGGPDASSGPAPQAASRKPQASDPKPPPYRLTLADGSSTDADGLILACPAHVSAGLVRDIDAQLADELASIRYASSATMSLAFRRTEVPHPLDGFGFVVPAVETSAVMAVTFSNVKFPNRAPEGWVLMRAFLGGAMHAHVYAMGDDALAAAVRRDLRDIVGVEAPPAFAELYRWPESMPQYPVGHLDRVKSIDARLAALPGLAVAGNAFDGVGIPDCVHSGETAAERLLAAVAVCVCGH